MNPLRRALIGLGVVGFALAFPVAAIIATSDHTNLKGLIAGLSVLVAWSYLGTGLYLWDRRPVNLTGPLMVALGFSWLVSGLSASNTPGLFVIGTLFNGLPFAILTHLLFAFPSGRLEGTWDRRFVALGYAVTTIGPALGMLFFDPAVSDDCPDCPDNPLQVWDSPDAYNAGSAISSVLAAIVLGALVWHLVRRWRDASDYAERLRDAPVWWAGGATLLLVLLLLGTNLGPEEGNFDDYVYAAALLVLATIPYAFWLGAVRSRLWEAARELRESRARIVEAGYAERKRVERDLHDGAQQRLVALALELQVVQAKLGTDPEAAAQLLQGAADELAGATQELRELARGLHPPVLTDRGLVPALEALARRATVPVTVEAADGERAEAAATVRAPAADEAEAAAPGRAPEAVEAAAYFVVAEALTNVARYADAKHAVVRVARRGGELCVEVEDDGKGGADPSGGSGLRGLADRVGALDGSLEVDSVPGRGTTVRASLPMR
jgi:signal transduction histidine kinase